MRRRSELKLIFGFLIWIGLIGTGLVFARGALNESNSASKQVVQFLATPYRQVELQFTSPQIVKIGALIFLERDGLTTPVGRVTRVEDPNSAKKIWVYTDRVFAELYSTAPEIGADDFLTFHETPESFGWVAEMMLPPATRAKIGGLILGAYRKHQHEIITAFQPIIENSIRDSMEIIRTDLQNALAKRELELARLGEKFRSDLVEKELTPLVQNEIWPIVQHQSQPLVNEIGQEIWDEVSIWRFTWKYLYDRTPLPQRNLADKEFRRFVDSKIIPILESHLRDIVSLQREILNQIAGNEEVKDTFSRSVREIMGDAEVQQLVIEIFREVILENPRLEAVLEDNWNSPEAQQALAITNARLDPTITSIGQILFGSPDQQITPEFSRVLRQRILHKDAIWFTYHVAEKTASPTDEAVSTARRILKVIPGETSTENPFHVLVEERTGS